MTQKFVAYYRVSTAQQGASGLGLEAQRRAAQDYLRQTGGELIGEFEEVESGKRSDRPAFERAKQLCALTGARLVIAKLDRLARDVEFTAGLMKSGIDFVACDNPHATKFLIHILAVIAEEERDAISTRTKAALGSIKARLAAGQTHVSRRSGATIRKLGSPKGLSVPRPDLGTAAKIAKADKFAAERYQGIAAMRSEGLSLAAIATRLNDARAVTPRGREWTAMAVKRVLDRAEKP